MNENQWLVERFEADRAHLRGVAYRLLGSYSDVEDALQEAWIRASRADATAVDNLTAWLTTIVARVCLNMLQSRKTRREEPYEAFIPDPVITVVDAVDPEQEAVLADSVSLALLVVLDQLTPAERMAFVLHDVFAVSFDEIANIVGRSPDATRQLASRARRRVREAGPSEDAPVAEQRSVVDAFFKAAREGDFDALVAVLDPDVALKEDRGPSISQVIRGAETIASRAIMFSRPDAILRPVLVGGRPGIVAFSEGRPLSVMAFTVTGGRIVAIEVLADRSRLEAVVPPELRS